LENTPQNTRKPKFDGVATGDAPVVVVGATNRPNELDDAVRRRLVKRIYIPLPDAAGRTAILKHLLSPPSSSSSGGGMSNGGGGNYNSNSSGGMSALSAADIERVVRATDGYSASDLTALCREAALGPVRELGPAIATARADKIRPVRLADFSAALAVIRPSLNREQLRAFDEFTRDYGTV
jgi:spastin